jgi:NO-binding membrane sensor protein with MHYT domain
VLLIAGGTVAGVATWIGALFNTARLDDKTWFILLLILGICSFGFVAMIAYVVAGPDSTESRDVRAGMATAASATS